eukprot:CAMPEP_0198312428 /NCGR_PEP_ID=MMETSP1450-20131203/3800_1 /TAXON_ID=753684 ORGANISM="Madagascaria erythrocladiodes, Strain CCMP3234" /NCGR_SAMPLE_ID=MMETSP1450 /ASSEMBLY_ACC=CAM_ASM_001115 /LENGTH=109 /DNA_ID=CAMNT_0044015373 /DNA_START=21 /DNA_END=347 /DNA_ORIENTATION=+
MAANALWLSAKVVVGMNAAGFCVTAATKTHKITDLTGTAAFAASTLATAYAATAAAPGASPVAVWRAMPLRTQLLAACVSLWSARLGSHLFARVVRVGEDRRLRRFFDD